MPAPLRLAGEFGRAVARLRDARSQIRRHPVARLVPHRAWRHAIVTAAARARGAATIAHPAGFRLVRDPSPPAGDLYLGIAPFEEMAFALHYLRPDDVFLDCEAGIGTRALTMTTTAGCAAVAMESRPDRRALLERNVALNGADGRVTARDGVGLLAVAGSGDALDEPLWTGARPPAVVRVGRDAMAYLGEDLWPAEGGRPEVILLLPEAGPVAAAHDVHLRLSDLGYHRVRYDPFTRAVRPSGAMGVAGGVYVADIDGAARRVLAAPTIRVLGMHV